MTGNNKHRSVYIENSNDQYDRMFAERGWRVVQDPESADMIQFTGGADVSPWLYGKSEHPRTHTNPERDRLEVNLFDWAQEINIPCAGICRGSQLLHALNGGQLVQHCDEHAVGGGHEAEVAWMPGKVLVSSTHHQMMGDATVGDVLVHANKATFKQTMCGDDVEEMVIGVDIEGMYYPKTNSISFQPHPEFSVDDRQYEECADVYFFMLENYMFGGK